MPPKRTIFSKETLIPVGMVVVIIGAIIGFSDRLTKVEAEQMNQKEKITITQQDQEELRKDYYTNLIQINEKLSTITEKLKNLTNNR